jgi:hypothetical protein
MWSRPTEMLKLKIGTIMLNESAQQRYHSRVTPQLSAFAVKKMLIYRPPKEFTQINSKSNPKRLWSPYRQRDPVVELYRPSQKISFKFLQARSVANSARDHFIEILGQAFEIFCTVLLNSTDPCAEPLSAGRLKIISTLSFASNLYIRRSEHCAIAYT